MCYGVVLQQNKRRSTIMENRHRAVTLRLRVRTNKDINFMIAIEANKTIQELARRILIAYVQLVDSSETPSYQNSAKIKVRDLTVSAIKFDGYYITKQQIINTVLRDYDEIECTLTKAKPKYPNEPRAYIQTIKQISKEDDYWGSANNQLLSMDDKKIQLKQTGKQRKEKKNKKKKNKQQKKSKEIQQYLNQVVVSEELEQGQNKEIQGGPIYNRLVEKTNQIQKQKLQKQNEQKMENDTPKFTLTLNDKLGSEEKILSFSDEKPIEVEKKDDEIVEVSKVEQIKDEEGQEEEKQVEVMNQVKPVDRLQALLGFCTVEQKLKEQSENKKEKKKKKREKNKESSLQIQRNNSKPKEQTPKIKEKAREETPKIREKSKEQHSKSKESLKNVHPPKKDHSKEGEKQKNIQEPNKNSITKSVSSPKVVFHNSPVFSPQGFPISPVRKLSNPALSQKLQKLELQNNSSQPNIKQKKTKEQSAQKSGNALSKEVNENKLVYTKSNEHEQTAPKIIIEQESDAQSQEEQVIIKRNNKIVTVTEKKIQNEHQSKPQSSVGLSKSNQSKIADLQAKLVKYKLDLDESDEQ